MEYYVYVLRSKKDKGFYVGYTTSLKDRLDLHDRGQVSSTKNRRPIELVYYGGVAKSGRCFASREVPEDNLWETIHKESLEELH